MNHRTTHAARRGAASETAHQSDLVLVISAVIVIATLLACGGQEVAAPRDTLGATLAAHRDVHWGVNGALLRVYPSSEEIHTRLALAIGLVDEREYEAAIANLNIVIHARPDLYAAHAEAARAYLFGRADTDAATASARRCIELRPETASCFEVLSMVLQDVGAHDEAIESLRRAQELDPTITPGERLPRLLFTAGHLDEALAETNALLEAERQSVSLLLLRATIYERLGEIERAEADFLNIAHLHAQRAIGYTYLSQFYARVGRTEAANAAMQEAARWR